jgi:repressor LexA
MSRKMNKTSQQRGKEVMVFVTSYFDRYFYSPTYEEILESLEFKSRGHLALIIEKLVEEGSLEREKEVARGLKIPGWIPPTQFNPFAVHLKGSIAANNENPLVVFEEMDADTIVEIPPSYIPKNTQLSDLYALTVQGDSMEDALIADGDTVILKQGDTWNDGDIVAVWLNDEGALTLKELYRGRGDIIKLRPRSHKHQTRVEKEGDVRVMGRVVAVLRKYANN